MPIDIKIPDQDIKFLNAPAVEQLRKNIEEYIDQILEEASRAARAC